MNENPHDFLAEYLADHDEPCPSCRYSLRGLQGAVCPECGQALVIRVGLAEPRMAAWIFGLVGISAGLGTSLLLTIYFIAMIVRHGWPFVNELAFFILVAGCPVGGVAVWAWIRLRRRVCRAGGFARWIGALSISTLPLASPVAFLAMIR